MNVADAILLGVILASGLLGLLRGLVREVLGLAAWALSAIAGIALAQYFRPMVGRVLRDSDLIDAASFLIPFLLALVFLMALAGTAGRVTRGSLLGGVDRMLGFFFGLARGAALIVAAFVAARLAMPPGQWPPALQQARALPLVESGAIWAVARVPEPYRGYLAPGRAPDDAPGFGSGPGASGEISGPGYGDRPLPSAPFGHPYGEPPHARVPTYLPEPSR